MNRLGLVLLVACGAHTVEEDPSSPAPSVAPPGTQIGGIDEADDVIRVEVVDAEGMPVSAEVTWNPDGDEFHRSKTCNEVCWLEVYGGLISYVVTGEVQGFAPVENTVTLGTEHAVGDYFEAELTLRFASPL